MKIIVGKLLALTVVLIGIGLCAESPGESSPHFVVLNDSQSKIGWPNAGSVFKLGPSSRRTLTLTRTLATGGKDGASGSSSQGVAMVQQGTGACIYLSDAGTADIAAFVYPTFAEVGRYTVPGVTNASFGLVLAARGNFLFAGYTSQQSPGFFIATWNIQSGCDLVLGPIYDVQGNITCMAISQDNKTLAVGYDYGGSNPAVDSFSVGGDGSLTEHGPYGGPFDFPTAVDITADSKYALFGEYNGEGPTPEIQIGIYAINPDGSFGVFSTFSNLGPAANAYSVWLSPNEKFLFVSGTGKAGWVTTLNFDEARSQLTYTGCAVKAGMFINGMATAFRTGSGGFLYVGYASETGGADVSLFQINPSTGCLTEAAGSPFSSGKRGFAESVAAWPPRPF